MNYFSPVTALILMILTTFMWGSWFQFSFQLKKFPVSGFMLLIYTFSLILVWVVILILEPFMLAEPIIASVSKNVLPCILIIILGMLWAIGMQINIVVVKNVGLIMSTSITATTSIILGTAISVIFGGLREGQSVTRIFVGAALLLCATIIGQYSGLMRDKDIGKTKEQDDYKSELKFRKKNLILLVFGSVFLMPCYNLAQSAFIQTDLKPNGVPQLVCIGMLAIGTFLGTLIYSGIQLTKNKQWSMLFSDKKVLLMAGASSVCHYGGNVLYALCAPVLSHAIAWPLGTSYNFWSYVWGIIYGEYKKTSVKTKLVLTLSMLGFVAGVFILC